MGDGMVCDAVTLGEYPIRAGEVSGFDEVERRGLARPSVDYSCSAKRDNVLKSCFSER